MIKFYDCKTAPSPRRVRMFIAEKKLNVETIEIDLKSGEQFGPEFKEINPNCTVPVLVTEDGLRFTSTAGIRNYIEAISPNPCLMGRTADEQGTIADLQWRIEMEGLMAVAEALRNSAPSMKNRALTGSYNYEQIPALADRGRIRLKRFLEGVEEIIGEKTFVAGDAFSVADIDLLVVLDFAKWVKIILPENAENARRWYSRVSDRASAFL